MSSRKHVGGLVAARPLFAELPSVYQDDAFLRGFLEGLDEVLAPVVTTLDCLDAYLDPHLAPDDFLAWLIGWLDLRNDEHWSDEQRRSFLAQAGTLFPWRGTRRGLVELLRLAFGVEPEVDDSGGAGSSTTLTTIGPEGAVPVTRQSGPPLVPYRPSVTVRLAVAEADQALARQVAAFTVPAHVQLVLEWQPATGAGGPAAPP